MRKNFVLWLLIVGILAACSSPDTKKVENQTILNLDDLIREYGSSKETLRSKYHGKEVVVLGVSGQDEFNPDTALTTDDGKYQYFDIDTSDKGPAGGLNCMVEKGNASKFTEIKKGTIMTVKGILYVDDGSLKMQPCHREFRESK
jgi:hypothetical protein